ncbi:MAG: LytTR family DNA-binding domain-containing protein [Burkholderiales bacterium]|jgi:two-component system response regulator AlgR|nr:LytTR family DNA-binding domain-containing protein [Burkholderiales bacterium]
MNTSEPCPLRILIADDEAPARQRLHDLLNDVHKVLPIKVVGEVETGLEALHWIQNSTVDLLLSDIHMPDMDGVEMARHLLKMQQPPRLIFVTAYSEHAVEAFDLNAIDYLMKPVRIDRLLAALRKVPTLKPLSKTQLENLPASARRFLPIIERSRVELVPIDNVIYFKAELKYVTVKTIESEHVLEESLAHLEQEFSDDFLRIHRSFLVARRAIKGFVRGKNKEGESNWQAVLRQLPERLPVSRRQRNVLQEFVNQTLASEPKK